MLHFTRRFIGFLLPVLICAGVLEAGLRRIPNDYEFKADYLSEHSAEVRSLILGSSHTYFGVNPEYFPPATFNAGHIGQTLEYDRAIFERYDWDELENLYLPISFFSLFSNIDGFGDPWRQACYCVEYDLCLQSDVREHFLLLSHTLRRNLRILREYYATDKSLRGSTPTGYSGRYGDRNDVEVDTASDPAARPIAHDPVHWDFLTTTLRELLSSAERRGVRVILFSTPLFPAYERQLDAGQWARTQAFVHQLTQEFSHCSYHDYVNDPAFLPEDYRDPGHLNDKGAAKLSRKLADLLEPTVN